MPRKGHVQLVSVNLKYCGFTLHGYLLNFKSPSVHAVIIKIIFYFCVTETLHIQLT